MLLFGISENPEHRQQQHNSGEGEVRRRAIGMAFGEVSTNWPLLRA